MSKKYDPMLGDDGHFHMTLGRAIASWQSVEDGLGTVHCALTGNINNHSTRASHNAVVNFNARLKMVDAAANVKLADAPEQLKKWQKLNDQVGTNSGIRNKLIHFRTMRIKHSENNYVMVLVPSMYDTEEWLKSMAGKGIKWAYPDIGQFGEAFGQLGLRLDKFAWELAPQKQR